MLTDVFTRLQSDTVFLGGVNFNFGAEHKADQNKTPPNIDCWATSDTWKPGEAKRGTGYSAGNRSVGTRAAGAVFRIWGGDLVKGTAASSFEHHAATEDLLRRFLVVLHREFFGVFSIRSMNWLGQDGAALTHFGRSVEVEVEFDVPINELDPGITSALITSEVHTTIIQPQPTASPAEVAPLVRWSMRDLDSSRVVDDMGFATLTTREANGLPEVITAQFGGTKYARRFSRLNIAPGNLVVPSGAFAQIDRADYDKLCAGEWTIGGWMRRDAALLAGAALTRIIGTRIGPLSVGPTGASPGIVRGFDLFWDNTTGAYGARTQHASSLTTVSTHVAQFSAISPLGGWQHVAFRKRNLSGNTIVIDLAVNGVVIESIAPTNGAFNYNPPLIGDVPPPAEQGKAVLCLGGSYSFDALQDSILYGIDGAFRDVRIYDVALKAAQIATWFTTPAV